MFAWYTDSPWSKSQIAPCNMSPLAASCRLLRIPFLSILPTLLVHSDLSRTSSPSNNSTPDQRTIQRTSLRLRHRPSCHLGSSRREVAVPADIASAGLRIRIVLEEVRIGLVAVRTGLEAGLVGRGSGCHRSSLVRRRPGCSMRVACHRGLGRHLGG